MGRVNAEIEIAEPVLAPLSHDEPRGKARIVVDGATIASHDLYPVEDAAQADFSGAASLGEALVD
jgi:hypothetical protein